IADLAADLGVPFARVGEDTMRRLAEVLDPGLEPGNPLDMWSASTQAQWHLTESLAALAGDPAVHAGALAVDLVTEPDGDGAFADALTDVAGRTGKPLAVLANIPAAVDLADAAELRAAGIPVLEGARTGLLALRHLLAHGTWSPRPEPPPVHAARRERWAKALRAAARRAQPPPPPGAFAPLDRYGGPGPPGRPPARTGAARAAAPRARSP